MNAESVAVVDVPKGDRNSLSAHACRWRLDGTGFVTDSIA